MKLYKKIRIFFLVVILIQANKCLYGMEKPLECPWRLEEITTVEDRKKFLKKIWGCLEITRDIQGTLAGSVDISNFNQKSREYLQRIWGSGNNALTFYIASLFEHVSGPMSVSDFAVNVRDVEEW